MSFRGEKVKTRKKHNPLKRYIAQAKIALKDVVMVYSTGGDGMVRLYNFNTLTEIQPTNAVINALNKIPHKWSFILCAFERDSNGKEKMKRVEVSLPDRYYRDDIVMTINDEHKKLTDSCWQELLCGAGWVSAPWQLPGDYDEVKLDELFTKLGAYSCPTKKEELA